MRSTGLDRSRIGANIQLSDQSTTRFCCRHINDHQYYLGLELQREIPLKQAAASWYDQVYTGRDGEFERLDAAELFPGHTAADLYVDAMDYLSNEKDWQANIDLRGVVRDYVGAYGARSLFHDLMRYSRRLFNRSVSA